MILLVVVAYDIKTLDKGGTRRLRKVARICGNYGQRVQNSVFECIINATEYENLKNDLLEVMENSQDSLRLYKLGNNYKNKVEHYGTKDIIDLKAPVIL